MTETNQSTDVSSAVNPDRPTVFIHTNHRQILGALVSQYSMKRNAANPDVHYPAALRAR